MPIYVFKCKNCGHEERLFTSIKRMVSPCPQCKEEYMERQMPVLAGSAQVRETVNKLTNTKWIDNQEEILKNRRDDYFWSKEVPRLVQSGTYSLETMLENNWVYFDDKGQLQTRTKHPSRE